MRTALFHQAPRFLPCLAMSLLLSACGGGGGGGTSSVPPGTPAPATETVATVSTDSLPSGGVAAFDLFAFRAGDVIVRDVFDVDADGADVATSDQIEQQTLAGATPDRLQLQFQLNAAGDPVTQGLRRTAQGWVGEVSLFADMPAAARAVVGEILLYPDTLYPVNALRSSIRQGTWGADMDGDGRAEGFRLEFTQVYLGEELRPLPIATDPVLVRHFRTTVRHLLMYSSDSSPPVEATSTVDEYVMPGVGVVRAERRYGAINADAPAPQVEVMTSGTVGGVTYSAVVSAPGTMVAP